MKKIIYVTVSIAVIFLSCKKDDNTSTAPQKKATRADLYSENGYVSGTIVSANATGTAFEKTFTHQLDSEKATYYVNEKGNYIIHLNKLDKFGRVGENDKRTEMTFTLNSNKTTLTRISKFNTSIYIDSTATAITKFDVDSDGTERMVLSNIVFNTADGTFTSDYVLTIASTTTSSRQPATITGKISTTLTNILHKTGSSL